MCFECLKVRKGLGVKLRVEVYHSGLRDQGVVFHDFVFSVEGLGFKVLVSRFRFERLGFGDLGFQFEVDGVDPSSSGWTIRARACSSSRTTPACPSPESERDYTPSVQ